MKTQYLSALLLSSLLLLAGCEKMVTDVDIPEYEPKLVVHSFISSDEAHINVYVSESIPVFGKPSSDVASEPIANATVVLRRNGQSITLPYEGYTAGYSIPVVDAGLQPGRTYTLEVSVPDGRQVTGECTIPSHRNETLEITSVIKEAGEFDSLYTFQFRFRDDQAGEGNHYRVFAYLKVRFDPQSEPYVQELSFDKGEVYVSDENRDLSTFTYRASAYAYKLEEVTFKLLTTDEDYYTYHRSVNFHSDGDPFSEPTLVFTNIRDGLGIFSGYRVYTVTQTF
ncbi:MAG TPA: DUF4249 domain-containing protein [Bacteroidales bacterium]|nr:DUF4249 domain-containing protein [Bacteroidales bacterium]HRZ76451.1 DUF4249 domain-containing protein [Bacteroidales bacterium]